jgi:glutamate synthase (NADPH/NADH) large chain
MHQLRNLNRAGYEIADIDLNYREEEGLQAAVNRICEESAQAVRDGQTLLILSDKNLRQVIYLQMRL